MTREDYIKLSNQKLNYYESNDGTAPTNNEELNKFFQQYEECFNRLPCGICRLTNMPCPKVANYEQKITYNHIGDPVNTKTTNHITSEGYNRPKSIQQVWREKADEDFNFIHNTCGEHFMVITDVQDYRCNTLSEVEDIVNWTKDNSHSYIIRYYDGGDFKGGYNLEELKEKLRGEH